MSAGFFGQGGFGQSAGFGGLAGGALGMAGTGLSAGISVAEGKKARDFQKKVMKRRYQWMASDLEKAGINRILAPSIGAGGASSPMANVPDFGQAISQGARAGSEVALKGMQRKLAEQNIAESAARTDASEAAARESDARRIRDNRREFYLVPDHPDLIKAGRGLQSQAKSFWMTPEIRALLGSIGLDPSGGKRKPNLHPIIGNDPISNW